MTTNFNHSCLSRWGCTRGCSFWTRRGHIPRIHWDTARESPQHPRTACLLSLTRYKLAQQIALWPDPNCMAHATRYMPYLLLLQFTAQLDWFLRLRHCLEEICDTFLMQRGCSIEINRNSCLNYFFKPPHSCEAIIGWDIVLVLLQMAACMLTLNMEMQTTLGQAIISPSWTIPSLAGFWIVIRSGAFLSSL